MAKVATHYSMGREVKPGSSLNDNITKAMRDVSVMICHMLSPSQLSNTPHANKRRLFQHKALLCLPTTLVNGLACNVCRLYNSSAKCPADIHKSLVSAIIGPGAMRIAQISPNWQQHSLHRCCWLLRVSVHTLVLRIQRNAAHRQRPQQVL